MLKKNKFSLAIHSSLLLLAFTIFSPVAAKSLTGTLDVVWGDGQPRSSASSTINYTLTQENGTRVPLRLSNKLVADAGGISKIIGKQVLIDTAPVLAQKSIGINIKQEVKSISLLNSAQAVDLQSSTLQVQGLAGSLEYVSILCKFSDIAAEPQDWNYFSTMYGDTAGQLGHFWRQVSSNNINLVGSNAYGGSAGNNGWYTLPSPRSAYVNTTFPNGDLDKLFNDCIGVADAHIDFTNVKGINLMFNDTIGPYAWGGGRYATLDGISKVWPTTWEPTWGWANVGIIAHEMGHSFGLPHSNNSDGDGDPYDSPWTVMSGAWSYVVSDATYGVRGKHTNSYEKDKLSWLTSGEVFTVNTGEIQTLNIDSLSDSLAGTGAYRMVKVPFPSGSNYYTIEARETTGEYEANLPGTAIIIHSVDDTRQEPSWVIDKDSPAADYADTEGVMWKVGETFTDSGNNISITVDSATTGGFQVTVNNGSSALGKAVLVAPSGSISDTTPTYTWNAVTGSTQYYLWVDDSSGNKIKQWYTASAAGCDTGTGTCSITPTTTLAAGNGKWWVQTWNTAGSGPWSDTMNFSISTTPEKAVLISPSGTISNTTPTYTWNAVAGSTWYYLWVDDSTGNKIKQWYTASAAGCDTGTGTCSITPTTALAAGNGKWWIQTWNTVGLGPWSNTMNFTLSIP